MLKVVLRMLLIFCKEDMHGQVQETKAEKDKQLLVDL